MSEQTVDDGSRTVAGAKAFIETKTRNYEIPANSGGAMITAMNKVFAVEPDPDAVDLSTVDLDEVFARFRIKAPELTDGSYAAYKSRVRRAVTMYKNWLNGENWRPSGSKPGKKPGNGKTAKAGGQNGTVAGSPSEQRAGTVSPKERGGVDGGQVETPRAVTRNLVDSNDDLFDYPVALVDSGVTAILRLPRSYTAADAARMAALINALAVPDSAPNKA